MQSLGKAQYYLHCLIKLVCLALLSFAALEALISDKVEHKIRILKEKNGI